MSHLNPGESEACERVIAVAEQLFSEQRDHICLAIFILIIRLTGWQRFKKKSDEQTKLVVVDEQ